MNVGHETPVTRPWRRGQVGSTGETSLSGGGGGSKELEEEGGG